MSFKADLHCHSTCSDGSLSPSELIEQAHREGLKGLSITDHDSVEAYPDVFFSAFKYRIQLIPGVEFSTHYSNESVHILGYSFDFENPDIHTLIAKHKQRRLDRNLRILEKLREEGMPIDPQELPATAHGTIGRPHIAKLLVEKGYVPTPMTAFQKYIGDGKKCYVAGSPLTIEETIHVIHQAQGFAVLAHPHLYKSPSFVKEILSRFPFDGLECEYSLMTSAQNSPWLDLAHQKNLLITGGSDFHGDLKPNIRLGSTITPQARFEPLLQRFLSHHPQYSIPFMENHR